MERLILPDGSAIGSGVWGQTAILSICRCADRNEGSELTLLSTRSPSGGRSIPPRMEGAARR